MVGFTARSLMTGKDLSILMQQVTKWDLKSAWEWWQRKKFKPQQGIEH
jgi:hypothetical protein